MHCEKCGANLSEDANFCRICGNPVDLSKQKQLSEKQDNDENEENNNIELTDNIDVTKIVVDKSLTSDTVEQESDEDVNQKKVAETFSDVSNELMLTEDHKELDGVSSELNSVTTDNVSENNDRIPTLELTMLPGEIENVIDASNQKDSDSSKEIANILAEMNIDNMSNINLTNEDDVNEDPMRELHIDDIKSVNEQTNPTGQNDNLNIDEGLENIMHNSVADENQHSDIPNDVKIDSADENKQTIIIEKKHGYFFPILLFVLLLVNLAFSIYLWWLVNENDKKVNDLKLENKNLTEQKSELNSELDKYKELVINNGKLIYNGYELILDNLYIDDNYVCVNIDQYIIKLMIENNQDFSSIKNSRTIRNQFRNLGYNVSNYGTRVEDSREYAIYEVVDSSKKQYLIAYTKLNNDTVIGFIIYNEDNSIDYDSLSETNKIIDNLKEYNQNNSDNIPLIFS